MAPLPTTALALCLLAAGPPPPLLAATDYFVSSAGDDLSGDGSAAHPWRSITRAAHAAGAGDVVRIGAGLYGEDSGDVFPIGLPAGISLAGAGPAGSARVRCPRSADMFLIAGAPGVRRPVSVEALFLDHSEGPDPDGPGAVFRLMPSAARFALKNSTVLASGDVIRLSGSSGQAGIRELELTGNVVVDQAPSLAGGAFLSAALARDYSLEPGRLVIRDNETYGLDGFLSLHPHDPGKLVVAGNRLHGTVWDGIVVETASFCPGDGIFLEGNTVTGCGADGIRLSLFVQGRSCVFPGAVRGNRATACGGTGLGVVLFVQSTLEPARLDFAAAIEGNLLAGNLGSGFMLEGAAAGGGRLRPPVLGDAPGRRAAGGRFARWPLRGLPGRNTLAGNEPWQLRARGVGFHEELLARGNWWGTIDPAAIAAGILDANDEPALGVRVDPRMPLQDCFGLALSRSTVRAAGGTRVSVAARPGGAFLPALGGMPIAVTLGGRPVAELAVASGGLALSFAAPPLAPGPANLVVANPNGSVGQAVMRVVR